MREIEEAAAHGIDMSWLQDADPRQVFGVQQQQAPMADPTWMFQGVQQAQAETPVYAPFEPGTPTGAGLELEENIRQFDKSHDVALQQIGLDKRRAALAEREFEAQRKLARDQLALEQSRLAWDKEYGRGRLALSAQDAQAGMDILGEESMETAVGQSMTNMVGDLVDTAIARGHAPSQVHSQLDKNYGMFGSHTIPFEDAKSLANRMYVDRFNAQDFGRATIHRLTPSREGALRSLWSKAKNEVKRLERDQAGGWETVEEGYLRDPRSGEIYHMDPELSSQPQRVQDRPTTDDRPWWQRILGIGG